MALYWHVDNKDELLDAMGDALLADVVPPPATGSWSTQLRGVVEALVDELGKHPAAAELVGRAVLRLSADVRCSARCRDCRRWKPYMPVMGDASLEPQDGLECPGSQRLKCLALVGEMFGDNPPGRSVGAHIGNLIEPLAELHIEIVEVA